MDEATWLACTDPMPMLGFLRTSGNLSERKARLFAVACCRRIWQLVAHADCRRAVERSEQYADGGTTAAELRKAERKAKEVASALAFEATLLMRLPRWAAKDAAQASAEVARKRLSPEMVAAKTRAAVAATPGRPEDPCDLLRDLFGLLPFRSPPRDAARLAWNNGTITRLAEGVYEERIMPGGTLDNERLGVLADALEEAGADAGLVGHLRWPGPHVRGCHGLDLLLNKE